MARPTYSHSRGWLWARWQQRRTRGDEGSSHHGGERGGGGGGRSRGRRRWGGTPRPVDRQVMRRSAPGGGERESDVGTVVVGGSHAKLVDEMARSGRARGCILPAAAARVRVRAALRGECSDVGCRRRRGSDGGVGPAWLVMGCALCGRARGGDTTEGSPNGREGAWGGGRGSVELAAATTACPRPRLGWSVGPTAATKAGSRRDTPVGGRGRGG